MIWGKYAKSQGSKISINSEALLKGGKDQYEYAFEFNINFFLCTLSSLIKQPNLMINIFGNVATFKELDIVLKNC